MHDFSIQISQDLMTNLDLTFIALQEIPEWRDSNKIVETVMGLQFQENTWTFKEDRKAEKPYEFKTEKLFSCQAFGHELVAIATLRNPNDTSFEYVAYTSQTALNKKADFEKKLQAAYDEAVEKAKQNQVP